MTDDEMFKKYVDLGRESLNWRQSGASTCRQWLKPEKSVQLSKCRKQRWNPEV